VQAAAPTARAPGRPTRPSWGDLTSARRAAAEVYAQWCRRQGCGAARIHRPAPASRGAAVPAPFFASTPCPAAPGGPFLPPVLPPPAAFRAS